MKRYAKVLFFVLFTIYIASCASSARSPNLSGTTPEGGGGISALGTLGRLEIDASVPLYTGNGGSDIRLAILAPETYGDVPAYLPVHVQGLLNNIFNMYSAINLIDRQNLDRIISEQNIAASGRFSDTDFITIGDLTNTQYFLFGTIQRLSGGQYSLQLSITEAASGIRRATFMIEASLVQFEGRGTLVNEAAANLLTQMGVTLTEAGMQSLLAGNTSMVRAEYEMARGITALAGGDELGALFNITQAITFDPTNLEAISRLSTLSTSISGGTISQRIVNDILARDRWLEVFKETANFFNNHPPFEIVFDPNLIQIGETDFARRTVNLGMRIAVDSSEAGFNAINALLEGLENTGRRDAWGFSGWPLMDINPRERDAVLFSGRRSFTYRVDVRLLNENGRVLGNSTINLNTDQIRFSSGDRYLTAPGNVDGIVTFTNVRAEDLTPSLTILILAVNGISSENLASTGYMRIDTGDLEARIQEQERIVQQELVQREMDIYREQQRREAEQRQRAAQRQQELNNLRNFDFMGYTFVNTMPIGFTMGISSYYASVNFGFPANSGTSSPLGGGEEFRIEWIVGYSFPINRTFRVPVGLGFHHYGVSLPKQFTYDETKYDWENSFTIEAGLTYIFSEMFYASSTFRLRLIDADPGLSLSIGITI